MSALETEMVRAVCNRFDAKPAGSRAVLVGRKRVSLSFGVISGTAGKPSAVTRPRLRFDKVALRVVQAFRERLAGDVPDGQTLLLTVTAPIRQGGKMVAAIEEMVRKRLARRTSRITLDEIVFGNEIQARLVPAGPKGAARVAGFVHNPGPEVETLFEVAESLLTAAAKPGRGERWLVLGVEKGWVDVDVVRRVWEELAIPGHYSKVMMVGEGRVELVVGEEID